MLRFLFAVLIGYLVSVGLVVAKFAFLAAVMPEIPAGGEPLEPPGVGLTGLILFTDVLTAIIAGWVCAWIARERVMRPAAVLGVLMSLGAFGSMLAQFGREPFWYQLALIVVLLPSVLFGAYLKARARIASAAR